MVEDKEYMRTIEIEGVKLQVDMRTAKKVEAYRVGDKVKVLIKDYSSYKSHPGIIVGIDAFKNLPTVVIAYIADPLHYDGSGGKVSFAYLNAQTKGVEICPMEDADIVPTRETMIAYFDRALAVKRKEIDDIVMRREYFLRQYGTAFGIGAEEVAKATAEQD